ncbi:thioesterase family protein [Hymenobacter sp.]|jgi:predicted thioesterase|uniref:thioesterase family protein n=1 Tax=Hymenobacter sp. TaxID=1898978 RepID=UPI002EDADBC8
MKHIFHPGDIQSYSFPVTPQDFAVLNGKLIHPVLSTFALGQALEWSSRQFVELMLEEEEEGIGTLLTIEHRAPAFEKETVEIQAIFERLEGAELICYVEARVGERLVATGRTGQRIISKAKLEARFQQLRQQL